MPHIDFGTRWTVPPLFDRYHRVSWVPTTGELYVADAEGSRPRVLAVVRSQPALEAVLAGWGSKGAAPRAPLAWVEQRVHDWLERSGAHHSSAEAATVGCRDAAATPDALPPAAGCGDAAATPDALPPAAGCR